MLKIKRKVKVVLRAVISMFMWFCFLDKHFRIAIYWFVDQIIVKEKLN